MKNRTRLAGADEAGSTIVIKSISRHQTTYELFESRKEPRQHLLHPTLQRPSERLYCRQSHVKPAPSTARPIPFPAHNKLAIGNTSSRWRLLLSGRRKGRTRPTGFSFRSCQSRACPCGCRHGRKLKGNSRDGSHTNWNRGRRTA